MDDLLDALHIGTLTVGCGLFVVSSAVGEAATMLDALPLVFAIVGVTLHRTGQLDDDGDEQDDATDAEVRESIESLEDRPAPRVDADGHPVADGGEA